MFCIWRFAQSVGLLLDNTCVFILQVFIPIYRGVERRWEFSRYINLSCLKLWFFTLDLFPDLILVLWRTNFKSILFPKEQRLLQYREGGCRDKCRVSGRTLRTLSFVNSGEVASDEICFWWPLLLMTLLLMTCLQELFFRLVSSDAFFQMLLSFNKFLCSWLVQSEFLWI